MIRTYYRLPVKSSLFKNFVRSFWGYLKYISIKINKNTNLIAKFKNPIKIIVGQGT